MRNAVLVLALVASACSSRPAETTTSSEATSPTEGGQPRVVIAIVLDQFPSYAYEELLPHLDEDGLLRRMSREGAVFTHARYDYATTNTAPGHAAIHTGEPPRTSGIDTNDLWDIASASERSIVADGEHPVFGVDGATASPAVLTAPTVADRLREVAPNTRVVSLSFKNRAAILSAGSRPNVSVWYDRTLPGFTTSRYYSDEAPAWLVDYAAAHPVTEAMVDWTAEDPALYERLFGPDDAEGEADWYGLGTTFPHQVAAASEPHRVLAATPAGVDYLLGATRAAIDAEGVGEDDIVDLICLSISSIDYVGHSFSTQSWEYLDLLRKTDRALASLVSELEESSTVTVLLTSDHGGPRMPERTGLGARIWPEDLATRLDAAIDAKLGDDEWIAGYVQPYLYPTPIAWKRRTEVLEVARAFAAEDPALRLITMDDEAAGWLESDDPLLRAVALSIRPGREAFFVVPNEHYFADPEREQGHGTSHGTPWDYDREVPVLIFGPGVAPARVDDVVPQHRVSSTIADLLDAPAPTDAPSLLAN